MKRFWKDVATRRDDGGHAILLDGRPVRTPARLPLIVPTAALADAVADEWRAAGDDFDPMAMVLTGLANAAIDRISVDPAPFVDTIAAYGESDLLCYRAEGPKPLVAAEADAWDPLLDRARAHYGVTFVVTAGIVHVAQPPATLAALRAAVAAQSALSLAALSVLVPLGGSLIAGLAVAGGADPAEVWAALTVDERWQATQWGEDAEAEANRLRRSETFLATARLYALT